MARLTAAEDKTQNVYARLVGFFYLFNDVLVMFGQVVASKIRGSGDFIARSHSIATSEHLYRMALVCTTLGWITVIFLAFVLYVTLEPVNRRLAQVALLCRIGEAFIGAVAVVLSFARLHLFTSVDTAGPFSTEQLQAMVAVTEAASGSGFDISMAFLGVGSTLFFFLFYQSRYIPRFLAGLGVFGSVLLFLVSLADMMLPEYEGALQLGWSPIAVAEIATAIWLAVFGVRRGSFRAKTSSAIES